MSDPTAPAPADAEQRLRRLEATVERLATELADLRAALPASGVAPSAAQAPPDERGYVAGAWPHRAAEGAATPAPVEPAAERRGPGAPPGRAPGAPPPRPAPAGVSFGATWKWPDMDVESLVGRYGTMILGALTIVLGVGAFLSWAVQRIQLGPGARVLLGALAAAGIGAVGLWLRRRGTRRFGNVLLALALAVLHVVAWGAGPGLGVVPPAVALAVAAAASLALAGLAWSDGEQALFVVGVGGALLAPFVTAAEAGDPVALLGYGWLVVAASAAALRDRHWPWAARLLVTGVLTYTGVALDATTTSWSMGLGGGRPWVRRDVPGLFVLACAWAALLVGGRRHRSAIARQLLLVLLLAVAWRGTQTVGSTLNLDLVLLAGAGLVTLYAALRQPGIPQPLAAPSAVAQPFLLLGVALTALPQPGGDAAAVVAAGTAALALLAALDAGAGRALAARADEAAAPGASALAPFAALAELWPLHLLVAALTSALAIGLALDEGGVLAVVALAAHAAGTAWLARRSMRPVLLVSPTFVLTVASLWAAALLAQRPAYAYVPLLTTASVAALACVAAWWLVGRDAARLLRPPATGPVERAMLRALGPAAAFVWGYAELGRAFSPELSSFALIAYMATAGVLLILLGRLRAIPGSRRVGLALAVLAAFRAIAEASDFDAVGLRVGSYLLVGGFLLAVAYWYRAAGEAEAAAPTPDAAGHDAGSEAVTLRP